MSYWYNDDTKDSWVGLLLVGAVAGALVVGVVWLGTWWLSPDDPEPPRAAISEQPAPDDPAEPGEAPATNRLEGCRSIYEVQTEPLRAATDSLDQWQVHIGAMNKLVTGAITLQQARQFWNQTRLGARARLDDFAGARRSYVRRLYRCPAPASRAEPKPELEQCHAAVAARGRSLRLATIALRTWEEHVHHMEMLRDGEMTPEEATRLWLASWQEGNRQVRAYRDAARAARGLAC